MLAKISNIPKYLLDLSITNAGTPPENSEPSDHSRKVPVGANKLRTLRFRRIRDHADAVGIDV